MGACCNKGSGSSSARAKPGLAWQVLQPGRCPCGAPLDMFGGIDVSCTAGEHIARTNTGVVPRTCPQTSYTTPAPTAACPVKCPGPAGAGRMCHRLWRLLAAAVLSRVREGGSRPESWEAREQVLRRARTSVTTTCPQTWRDQARQRMARLARPPPAGARSVRDTMTCRWTAYFFAHDSRKCGRPTSAQCLMIQLAISAETSIDKLWGTPVCGLCSLMSGRVLRTIHTASSQRDLGAPGLDCVSDGDHGLLLRCLAERGTSSDRPLHVYMPELGSAGCPVAHL